MRIALNIVGGAIIALLALPFLATVSTNGYYVTVNGTSMVPTYQRGDILLVSHTIDASALHAGNIVVVDPARAVAHYSGSSLRLGPYVHRILQVKPGERFVTKGDGNALPDPGTVTPSLLSGRPTGIRLTGTAAYLFSVSQNMFVRGGMLFAGLAAFVLASSARRKHRERVPAAAGEPTAVTHSA
ncbi:type I signal peptidase [Leifsonia xyli subsp. cynodontis DSM 46306]|uniref:Signal peptidase I n=1 Tax=Leifsonia xyli subsp. cynodontis DSM 46306 TaxID=1389489 RepID=U3PEW5_LEIXC|nr:signal peptidase I [Leifsonia xyli]AGW40545.1 type I signal peptidase [Leifsonia xyli subsp. cynodontis DSM 46306]AGW42178.1 type I signal peptidase [Leifsonia xyli subsp. cynodontis DSM 46306]